MLNELCPFWRLTEKIQQISAHLSVINKSSCYIFQLLEQLKVTEFYIVQLLRAIKGTGGYIFQLLEVLKVMGRYIFQLLRVLKVMGCKIFQNLNPLVTIPFPLAHFYVTFKIYYLYPPFGPPFFPFFKNQKITKRLKSAGWTP